MILITIITGTLINCSGYVYAMKTTMMHEITYYVQVNCPNGQENLKVEVPVDVVKIKE